MTSAATSRHGGGARSEYARHPGGGMVIFDVAALYALCVYDSRENLGTRRAA